MKSVKEALQEVWSSRVDVKERIVSSCKELKEDIGESGIFTMPEGGFNPMALMGKIGDLAKLADYKPRAGEIIVDLGIYLELLEEEMRILRNAAIAAEEA